MKIKKQLLYNIVALGLLLLLIFASSSNPYLEVGVYLLFCGYIIAYSLFFSKNALSGYCLFLYFYMLFLGIGMIYLRFINYSFANDSQLFYVASGLLCFVIGYLLVSLTGLETRLFTVRNKINDDTLFFMGKFLCFIGIIFGLVYLVPNIEYLLSDYENNRIKLVSGNGVLMYLNMISIPGCFVLYESSIRNRKKGIWGFIIISCLLMLLTGSRAKIMEVVIGMLLVRNHYIPVNGKKILRIAIIAIIGVSILGTVRAIVSGQEVTFLWALFGVVSVNDINFNSVLSAFPKSVPFQYGSTYFMNFRVLLPGTQPDFTMWVKTALKQNFAGGGTTPSILGEGYINFGVPGIFVTMLVIGIAIGIADNTMKKLDYCVPTVILILYLCRSVSGGIANVELVLIWFECVVMFVYIISRYRIRMRE